MVINLHLQKCITKKPTLGLLLKKKIIPANNLNAVEIEGRVYFIINKFPIDSGIRTADGPLNSAVLNEWENLRKIDNNAALGYMVIKRKSDE